jgi:hypothetical protein
MNRGSPATGATWGRAALLAITLALPCTAGHAEQGRLLGTGGATALEGSGGGGLVPWAMLSGYGTEDELGGAVAATRVRVNDYRLDAYGGSFALWNRLELSLARQRLEAEPFDAVLRQNILGAKLRLVGDLIYTRLPQISIGAQWKHNLDFDLPKAVHARRQSGVDYYVGASKLFLGGLFGYSVLASTTLRATRANEMGLLGFGGDRRSAYSLVPEGSLAVMLTKKTVLGYEYRAKPDNLRGAPESDWQDVFLAYFINKRLALVGAYADLGNVAGARSQIGWYLSLQGSF